MILGGVDWPLPFYQFLKGLGNGQQANDQHHVVNDIHWYGIIGLRTRWEMLHNCLGIDDSINIAEQEA